MIMGLNTEVTETLVPGGGKFKISWEAASGGMMVLTINKNATKEATIRQDMPFDFFPVQLSINLPPFLDISLWADIFDNTNILHFL